MCSSKKVFLKTCNFIKKRLQQRCFPVKFTKFLGIPSFTERLWWLLLSFLKQKSKNEKIYPHEHIHRKTPVIVSFLVQLQPWELTILRRTDSILDAFCEVCEVLQNLIFTEDSWATASNFQQHFGHITCSISNKST